MKIIVCGPIGYSGADKIRELQSYLRERGYEVLDQLKVDYSHVEDFRGKPEICYEIVRNDLEICERADVIVFIATNPSFGAMAEVVVSSLKGKPVIAFCPERVKSPWPLYFSTIVVEDEDELIKALESIKLRRIKTIPNVHGESEIELIYDKFKCICPVTGRIDYAVIKIKYKPKDKLIEYESLDEYFKEFENKTLHHEAVVRKIFNDIHSSIQPKSLEITAEFEERSGVKAIVRLSSKNQTN